MINFKILPELKNLIPPLTSEEYNQLEKNCLNEGIREKLMIAEFVDNEGEIMTALIDGHNRFAISETHNLEFVTETRGFESLDEIKLWMIDNQKGRRNLTDFVKFELSKVKTKILAEKGRKVMKESGAIGGKSSNKPKNKGLSIIDKPLKQKPHNTQKEIAKDLGWSTGKVAMAKIVDEKAKPEVKEALRKNEVTISKVYNDIKREEVKEKQIVVKQERQQQPISDRKYNLIYCDPPWKYDFSNTSNREIENHYPTMSIEDLKNLSIPSDADCICYMWATAPKLPNALELLDSWGFKYKTHSIWDKQKIGMGYWFRGQHELLLVGVKGSMSPPEPSDRISSIYSESRTKHSKKPNFFYSYLNETFPNLLKVELFARGQVEGFDNWGNENI